MSAGIHPLASVIAALARGISGVQVRWAGCRREQKQRIYFANHRSHGDFVLIWTVLPPRLRRLTRPVAGADYWLKSELRTFIGQRVFRAVLIDRNPATRDTDPIAVMATALRSVRAASSSPRWGSREASSSAAM